MHLHVWLVNRFQGDVQTSVSILIVLGELGKRLLPDALIKQWFSTYIGMFLNVNLHSMKVVIICGPS